MTVAPLQPPLASRPRRPRRAPEPTQREAARALRRTVPPTTGRSWTRGGMPGPVRASARVPLSEALASLFVVALLFVPVAVWTQGAAWVPVTAAAALLVAGYLLWARRVLVGDGYVAVRQVGRFHIATADHVRHLELRPSPHGGVLCLHTDDGRCMRLRRCEVSQPDINAALRLLAGTVDGTRDPRVEHLLGLEHAASRIRHRYLADAVR